ncbi:unnamed protein product [Knipowitschia caucasica]
MSLDNLSRIFSVSRQSLYLTNEDNVVLVAGTSGIFCPVDLLGHNHYEVHGVEEVISAPVPTAATAPANANTRFSFSRSASATAVTASRPTSKGFQRSMYLAEVSDNRLNPTRMVVIRFVEAEANIEGITVKMQEAIGDHQPLSLTDSQGNLILDSEGTRGSLYWKQNARQIFAVKECDYQELERRKRRRRSRKDDDGEALGEVAEKLEELVPAASHLPEITNSLKELMSVSGAQKGMLIPSQLQTVKEGFSCVICMKFMEEPVFTLCCKNLIGCRECIEQWQQNSPH